MHPQPVNTARIELEGPIHAPATGEPALTSAPVDGAFDALLQLMSGMAVVVRTDHDPDAVAQWLADHGFHLPITTGDPDEWKTKGTLLVTRREVPAMLQLNASKGPYNWRRSMRDVNEIGIPGYNRHI
jgi:hypothetical protein